MNCNEDLKLIIKNALSEDIGNKDITTEALISPDIVSKAVIVAKQGCVVCGLAVAGLAFRIKDRNIKFTCKVSEGDFVRKGSVIATLYGKANNILSVERVALNFLSHLSGIATKTRQFVDEVSPYKVRIMDTRKTTPGLRILEKYAVRIGGGYNHRMGLDEMVMIKDNHIKIFTSQFPRLCLSDIVERARRKTYGRLPVEIEVKNLFEFYEAIKAKPDIIMLDNMKVAEVKRAVNILKHYKLKGSILLEASGGISLKNVREFASSGVDMISIGELTHSVKSIDLSLEFL